MKKLTFREWLGIAVALAAVYVLFIGYNPFAGGIPAARQAAAGAPAGNSMNTDQNSVSSSNGGLEVSDLSVGSGDAAAEGDTVTVNYVGTLTDGTKFDSSYDRKQPFTFTIGAGQVIKGWDLGLVGMKVGGKRQLVIPPALGYGSSQVGPIPADSTLVFQIELLSVTHPSAAGTAK